jgi:hypothetical protein
LKSERIGEAGVVGGGVGVVVVGGVGEELVCAGQGCQVVRALQLLGRVLAGGVVRLCVRVRLGGDSTRGSCKGSASEECGVPCRGRSGWSSRC